MPTVQPFPAGGYRFISPQFQYSGGVAAEPGFRLERARFARSVTDSGSLMTRRWSNASAL